MVLAQLLDIDVSRCILVKQSNNLFKDFTMPSLFRSKKEIVYDLLRDNIINGKYEPESRLVIDELATHIGASQIPIREALQQLEADGFVTIEPYVGARVTPIDATFIYEVFGLLEAMEVISSRAACTLMTDDNLETLSQMVSDMDKTLDDSNTWSEQNRAMHLFICECAKTALILKMMQKVFSHWERLRCYYLEDVSLNRLHVAQKEHHQLLEAFQKRDPAKVEEVIHQHNESALKDYIKHLKAEGHLNYN